MSKSAKIKEKHEIGHRCSECWKKFLKGFSTHNDVGQLTLAAVFYFGFRAGYIFGKKKQNDENSS